MDYVRAHGGRRADVLAWMIDSHGERERDVAAWCVCMDEDETDRAAAAAAHHSAFTLWCVCTLLQGDETGGLDGRCLTREAYVHVHRS